MAINQTPGEIYFIREQDVLTHSFTNYVKVGLVRENEGRSSQERLLEHQTGNPRKLSIEKIVHTHAVSAIEGVLHGKFAQYRTSGEWFDFSPVNLQRCIEEAEALSVEAAENITKIAEAARLKDVPSTDEVLPRTEELEELYRTYDLATATLKVLKDIEKKIKALYVEAAASGDENVEHLIERQERRGRIKLDRDALFAAHPEIMAKYSSEVTTISGRATFSRGNYLEFSLSPLLGEGSDEFWSHIDTLIFKVQDGELGLDALQIPQLRLAEYITTAEWLQEISSANLKAHCGTAAGIEGILKWVRTQSTESVFNEKLFKESEPDLYAEFSTTADDVVAHRVRMTKANPNGDQNNGK